MLSFRQRVSVFPLISPNGGDLHLTEIMKLTTAIISAWNWGSVSPAIVNNRDLGTETKCASCVGYTWLFVVVTVDRSPLSDRQD